LEKPTWAQSEPDLCAELEERLRFETLLANLSARFVNVPPDHVDAEIVDAQRSICECPGFDLSALWQQPAGEHPDIFVQTHYYRSLEGPPAPDRMLPKDVDLGKQGPAPTSRRRSTESQ